MLSRTRVCAILLAAIVPCFNCFADDSGNSESHSQFADPATPVLNKCTVGALPKPVAYDNLSYHSPPKTLAPSAVTEDWPTFLGPRQDGQSRETNLLKSFGAQLPRLVWEVTIGEGYASPSVVGNRLVLFHREGDSAIVDCLHAETGRRYWRYEYKTDYRDRFGFNGGPRSSPIIDEDRVYVHGVEGRLSCLDLRTGCLLWQRQLSEEFHVPQEYFGIGSTPLIEGDLLIVNLGAPKGPCLAAFDKRNGKLVWGAGDLWAPSYASPVAADMHGKRYVFAFAGGDSKPPVGGLLAVDPSDGSIRFRFPWRSRKYNSVNAATPVIVGDRVFVTASYGTGGAMIDVKPDGSHEVVWTTKDLGAHWATPIYRDGYLYGVDGEKASKIEFVCLKADTGRLVWRERIEWKQQVDTSRGKQTMTMSPLRSSLLWADGRFLCLGERGDLLWLAMSPDGVRVAARTKLFSAEETYAPPVISRGLLYILQARPDTVSKSSPRLLCYDFRATG